MHADAHFAIGKAHKVCEDYALAGETRHIPNEGDGGRPFAVLCDGCSGSPDTDFGSRLLARAAARELDTWKDDFSPERAAWLADGWRETLGLSPFALDATMMAVFELTNGVVRIVVVGDGVVAARSRDTGVIESWAIRYPSGAPGYLTYLLNPERKKTFLEKTGGKRTVTVDWGKGQEPNTFEDEWEQRIIEGDGDDHDDLVVGGPIWTIDRDPKFYDIIAVMSDGAESFQRQKGTTLEAVPLAEVLAQIMSVKGSQGEFITRRLNKFLTKFCVKHGWQHYDDIAVAALAIEDAT